MKKNRGFVLAMTFALLGLALAPSAQADHVRPRDVLAMQDDVNHLDDSLAELNANQQRRLQPRVDAIRADLTNLRSRMNDPATWTTHVTTKEVSDLRTRINALQTDVDRAAARTAARPRYGREIPSGTQLDVRLDQSISSKTARVEQRVEATVVNEVIAADGRTVVPSGTVVTGYVAEVDDPDRADRDAKLRLEFTGLQFPNGTRADIRSTVTQVEDKHTGSSTKKRAGIGAILGGVLGGIIEGGSGAVIGAVLGAGGAVVATRGQHVELPEGAHLVLRLDQPTVLAQR